MNPDKSALARITRPIWVLLGVAVLAGSGVGARDLALQIVDSPDPVIAGAEMAFTITVTNTSDFQIPGVTVHVALPVGITPVSTLGCQEDTGGIPICSLGDINVAESAVYTITARVESFATGVLFTQAGVDSTTEISLPPDSVESTEIDSRVDLELDFSSDPDSSLLLPGQSLVYTAQIRNNSLARATDVLFQMNRPAPLRYISAQSEPRGDCFATSALITCRPGFIEGGESATVTVAFEAETPGLLLASALTLSGNGELDPADNEATLRRRVSALADLSVTKTADRGVVRAGGRLEYEISVSNQGPSPSQVVTLTDTLPSGVEPVSVQPSEDCQIGPAVVCSIGNLAPGETVDYRLTVDVAPDTLGELVNTARVSAAVMDSVSANNEASASVEVRLTGDLNGDGRVDILDAGPLIAEINDGDGQDAAAAGGGGFPGDAFFDINEDGLIDQRDVAALGRLILGKP